MSENRRLQSALAAGFKSLDLVLRAVLCDGRPADRVLAGHFRQHREYGSRDRRFIAETVFATLRWWGWLRQFQSRPEERLRSGGEDLSSLEWAQLALSAVLLDGQELRSKLWDPLAAAARIAPARVTAIRQDCELRSRRGALWALFGPSRQEPPDWSDLLPGWVLPEVTVTDEHERLVEYLQRRPPIWLRCRPDAVAPVAAELRERTGAAPQPQELIPFALKVASSRVSLYETEAYRDGLYEVQDLASQTAGMVCAPRPGQRWWDACAGGGGKALLLAELMQRKGTLVATDRREYKLRDLRRRSRRAGLPNIETKAWDGKAVRARKATFDGVLVDAPCTGSGTWRRNPDGRWSTTPDAPAEMAAIQGQILRAAAGGVKPGGVLVYITCSMFETENERVVYGFLEDRREFALEPFASPLTGREEPGMLTVRPWDGDCDILFAARLRRSTGEP